jgi:hypothetical protein
MYCESGLYVVLLPWSHSSFSELLLIRSRPTVACPVTRNCIRTTKVNQKVVWDQGVATCYCGLLIFADNYEPTSRCVENTCLGLYRFSLCLLSYSILWVLVDSFQHRELYFRARNMTVLYKNSVSVKRFAAGFHLRVCVACIILKRRG